MVEFYDPKDVFEEMAAEERIRARRESALVYVHGEKVGSLLSKKEASRLLQNELYGSDA